MGKIGRNDPCPCGSGKKYKKCCLSFNPQEKEKIIQGYIKDVMALDKLSNSINSLIEKKDFQKAQAVCQQLLDDYPDQIDGISRFAQVYEAMGNNVNLTRGDITSVRQVDRCADTGAPIVIEGDVIVGETDTAVRSMDYFEI